MKRVLIVLFGLLLLGGCGKPVDDLKVISFNIRYNSWYDRESPNCWELRRDAVVRMIREERPAALGLQEALIDQLQYLDSCLPQYRRVGVGRDDGMEAGEFMAIYYDTARLELLSDSTRWLSLTPEVPSKYEGAGCFRTVTVARFRDRQSGKEFAYLNTHLDHVSDYARILGAQVIGDIVANRLGELPAIVGGDMNAESDSSEYSPFAFFRRAGLQDARTLTDSTSHAITYNAFGQNDGAVIDHFFVRDVKVLRFCTLNGNYGAPYISDHYPIEILFRLPE
ncbi:MAG: endonuclease/exonuclease/phosphatase family protein [Bacteroidales bacterium]|nr:endonuclease/exonuclease/phosphatase family protein [Bacteroidales bacterium]